MRYHLLRRGPPLLRAQKFLFRSGVEDDVGEGKNRFCFALSQWLGGSGFIGAFVGGLLFGGLTKNHKEEVLNGA